MNRDHPRAHYPNKPSGFKYLRRVTSTDDGCEIYQCLNCHEQWEARTSPAIMGYNPETGKIFTESLRWKFCPVCGCAWKGVHQNRVEPDERHPAPKDVPGKTLVKFMYRCLCNGDAQDDWREEHYGTWYSAAVVLEELKRLRSRYEGNRDIYKFAYKAVLVPPAYIPHLPGDPPPIYGYSKPLEPLPERWINHTGEQVLVTRTSNTFLRQVGWGETFDPAVHYKKNESFNGRLIRKVEHEGNRQAG